MKFAKTSKETGKFLSDDYMDHLYPKEYVNEVLKVIDKKLTVNDQKLWEIESRINKIKRRV